MTTEEKNSTSLSRREFLGTTMALGAGGLTGITSLASAATEVASERAATSKPLNILFVLTDQERYFDPTTLPAGYSLPGRERLQNEGISFTNHQIATSVCSSSRSVIYTGQHIQHTGVFDNLGFP